MNCYPARRGKGRWLALAARVLRIEPYGYERTRQVGRVHVLLDPGDLCDRLFYFGLIGNEHESLLRKLLRPGDVVVDVGANAGWFTALCAGLVGPSGMVHGIESNPALAERMTRAFRSEAKIAIHHAAVCDTVGTVDFSIATFSGWSSLVANDTFQEKQRIRVPGITLDNFVRDHRLGRVRLLKLDIEGGEMGALRGASDTLRTGIVDYVLVETEPFRMRAFGWTGQDLAEFMTDHGFTAIFLKAAGGGVLQPVTPETRIPGASACDYVYARNDLATSSSGVSSASTE